MTALALTVGGCIGWSSACGGGFYFFEGGECDAAVPASVSVQYGAPCVPWSGPCPVSSCMPSGVGAAAGEELCTLPCLTDGDCGPPFRAPAVCAGDGAERRCHRVCPAGDACGEDERCVSAATNSGPRRVCVPRVRAYRPCAAGGAPCRSGLSCVMVSGRGGSQTGLCTVEGCATDDDCPEHELGIATCAAAPGGPTRRRCAPRCGSDADCTWYRTVCTAGDGDAGSGVCVPP